MRANCEIYTINGVDYCRSYNVIIAKREGGKVYLDRNYHDFSVTTMKHRHKFLGVYADQVRLRIDSGEYILTDLSDCDRRTGK